MKRAFLIVATFAIIVVIIALARDSKPAVTIPVTTPAATTAINRCYYAHTKTASGFYDTSWIRLAFDGMNVTGEFNNYPAEKDSKVGTIAGSVSAADADVQIATVIWDAHAEGMQEKDELLIKFDAKDAQPAFGEMIQGANGTFVYKDKGAAVYQAPIPAIDCTSLDEVIAVTTYIRTTDLQKLTHDSPVLGGSLYVSALDIDPLTHTAIVSYEDGHIAGKGTVAYTYDRTTGKVTVTGFTKSK